MNGPDIPMRRTSDGISLEGGLPGGIWARLSGVDIGASLVLIMVFAVIAISVIAWHEKNLDDDSAKKEYLKAHITTQTLLATVIDNQKAIITVIGRMEKQNVDIAASVNENSYILTLDQKRKEALRMEMPLSLRRKLNER